MELWTLHAFILVVLGQPVITLVVCLSSAVRGVHLEEALVLCLSHPELALPSSTASRRGSTRAPGQRSPSSSLSEASPQGKVPDPCYWRMSCKLVVENFQDAILLSNILLNCPPCVQRLCGDGLASGKESGDCRQQIGQRASVLLWIVSRRRIHFNKDVDCGRQGEDAEDVDVVVSQTTCEQGSELKRKVCTVGRESSGGSKVT